jgi:hypothetical protein
MEVDAHWNDHRRNSRVIVALLSGDSDFSHDVRKLHRHWFNVVMLHNPRGANRAMLDEIGAGKSRGNWDQLVNLCSDAAGVAAALAAPLVSLPRLQQDAGTGPTVTRTLAGGVVQEARATAPRAASIPPVPLSAVALRPTTYEFLTRFPKLLAEAVRQASCDSCYATFAVGSASVFARRSTPEMPPQTVGCCSARMSPPPHWHRRG